MKHTAGPWEVIIKGNTVKSHAIVSLDGAKVCCGISPKTANARLISAAPDLYDACHEEDGAWLWELSMVLLIHAPHLSEKFRAKMQKEYAAIAKAKGE